MAQNALIVVDLQNDFLPQGALGVKKADEIIPLINRLVLLPFHTRVASLDWHPKGHCSFASTWEKKVGERILIGDRAQTLWPDHCIQGTDGAEFSAKLHIAHFDHIVHKGIDPQVDSYSAFFDNQRHRSTGLHEYLCEREIQEVYFAGLTTEYCILYSVLDALELGLKVHVVLDACRGIELQRGDIERALRTMKDQGVEFLTTEEVEKRLG
jgi:nicotinamidase/pyrazinamidase